MFIRISQLVVISLVCLVGCAETSTNSSSTKSFLGCWQASSYDGATLIQYTYVFEPNKTFSINGKMISGQLPKANTDFVGVGTWKHDGDYLVTDRDSNGTNVKITFQILSDYELYNLRDQLNYSRC